MIEPCKSPLRRFPCQALTHAFLASLVFLTLGLSFLNAGCARRGTPADAVDARPAIVGGRAVPKDSPAWLSTVALVSESGGEIDVFCSGTLVADTLIVTAAHCVEDAERPANFKVLFGESVSDGRHALVEVADYQMADSNGSRNFPNFDLAWVKLARSAPAPFKPAEILRSSKPLVGGQAVLLAGYGKTRTDCDERQPSCLGSLLETETVFKESLNSSRFFSLLLLGDTPGFGACNGDSGGPAFAKVGGTWFLVGATNGNTTVLTPSTFDGRTHNCESGASVYTFLGDSVPWIESSAGVKVRHSAPEVNPSDAARTYQTRASLPDHPDLTDWFNYDNHWDEAWHTMDTIVAKVVAASKLPRTEWKSVYLDARKFADLAARTQELFLFGKPTDFGTLEVDDAQLSELLPIASLESLRTLVLSGHKITNFEPLASLGGLENLTITDNVELGSGRAVPIRVGFLRGLKRLRTLSLKNNGANVLFEAGAFANLSNLVSLDLSGTNLSQALTVLPWETLSALETLSISEASVADLSFVSKLPRLKVLRAAGNKISDLSALGGLVALEELDVTGNAISDFSVLSRLQNLRTVKARINPVRSKGCPVGATCDFDARGLPKTFLEHCLYLLDFDANVDRHWPPRATVQAVLGGLGYPDDKALTESDCMAVDAALRDKTHLDLSAEARGAGRGPRGLEPLAALPALEAIRIAGASVEDLTPLVALPQLKSLDVSLNAIRSVAPLARFPSLMEVDVSGNPLASFSGLQSPTLRKALLGSGDWGVSGRVKTLEGLGALPRLEELNIAHHQISDLSPLAQLKSLRKLDVSGNALSSLATLPPLFGLEVAARHMGLKPASCPIPAGVCVLGRERHVEGHSVGTRRGTPALPFDRRTRLYLIGTHQSYFSE